MSLCSLLEIEDEWILFYLFIRQDQQDLQDSLKLLYFRFPDETGNDVKILIFLLILSENIFFKIESIP